MPAYFLRTVTIEPNVTNYETICLTETECHPKQFVKIASAQENLQSFFAKFGLCGCLVRFANGLGKLWGDKNLQRCQSSQKCCQSSIKPCASFLKPCQNSLKCCQSFLSPSASSLMPCQSFLKPCTSSLKRCQSSLKPCACFLNDCKSSLKRCQRFLNL